MLLISLIGLLIIKGIIIVFFISLYFLSRDGIYNKSKKYFSTAEFPELPCFYLYERVHWGIFIIFLISIIIGIQDIGKIIYGNEPVYFHTFFYIGVGKMFSTIFYKVVLILKKKTLIYIFFLIQIACIFSIVHQGGISIVLGSILFCGEIAFLMGNTIFYHDLEKRINKVEEKISDLKDEKKIFITRLEGLVDKGIYNLHYIIPGLGLFTMKGFKNKAFNFPIFFIFFIFFGITFQEPSVLILHGILLWFSIYIFKKYKKQTRIADNELGK